MNDEIRIPYLCLPFLLAYRIAIWIFFICEGQGVISMQDIFNIDMITMIATAVSVIVVGFIMAYASTYSKYKSEKLKTEKLKIRKERGEDLTVDELVKIRATEKFSTIYVGLFISLCVLTVLCSFVVALTVGAYWDFDIAPRIACAILAPVVICAVLDVCGFHSFADGEFKNRVEKPIADSFLASDSVVGLKAQFEALTDDERNKLLASLKKKD